MVSPAPSNRYQGGNGDTQEVDPKNKGKKTKAKPEPTNKYVGEELDTLTRNFARGRKKNLLGSTLPKGSLINPECPHG